MGKDYAFTWTQEFYRPPTWLMCPDKLDSSRQCFRILSDWAVRVRLVGVVVHIVPRGCKSGFLIVVGPAQSRL